VKQTLYEILGVELDACAQDIEDAYRQRLSEWTAASMRKPDKLVALTRAKEILLDPGKRAAYDASLGMVTRKVAAHPQSAFLNKWGGWIVLAVAVVGLGLWWATRWTHTQTVAREQTKMTATSSAHNDALKASVLPEVKAASVADPR
jgi:hypothetical protein